MSEERTYETTSNKTKQNKSKTEGKKRKKKWKKIEKHNKTKAWLKINNKKKKHWEETWKQNPELENKSKTHVDPKLWWIPRSNKVKANNSPPN